MLAQPTQTTRIASGMSLEYVRQGRESETPLVFLHGFTDSCRSFSRLFEALREDIHAIAITLRGHGGSDRPRGPYDIATMARDVSRAARLVRSCEDCARWALHGRICCPALCARFSGPA